MLGALYLIVCIITGFMITSLVVPSLNSLFDTTYTGKKIKFPSLFFMISVSLVLGIMLLSWISYISAYILRNKQESVRSGAIISLMFGLIIIVIIGVIIRKKLKGYLVQMITGTNPVDIALFIIVLAFASYLMFYTFRMSESYLLVGPTVASDFSPHMGMINSFVYGDNIPTGYSHFAGEDIKYHFMFQYYVANLHVLGLPIDWAFNLPSILTFVSVCMLLYSLSVKLFAKRGVGVVAILFFLFRSGTALSSFMSDNGSTLKEQLNALKENTLFIGQTTNENWGLWNLNVYANQRHLALGMCLILISVMIMLQYYFQGMKRLRMNQSKDNRFIIQAGAFLKNTFGVKEGYYDINVAIPVFVGMLLGMGAFFNGACVIAALLILCFIAMFSDNRAGFILVAILAVGGSMIETNCFVNGSVVDFRWQPGFLAQSPTFAGMLKYIFQLMGLLPILVVAVFLMVNGAYKWILFAFVTPTIFALTCQMTPDVAVNHKYIMISNMCLSVFLGALIYRVFSRKGLSTKVVAIIICIAMTATGLYDFSTYLKANDLKEGRMYVMNLESDVTKWVRENATSKDVFLTDWYSLNEVVLGGAMLYYGWPYYAWSAGYDTNGREEQVRMMFASHDSETLIRLTKKNNIRFIIVDNAIRTNQEFELNEAVIDSTFKEVFTKDEGDWKFTIYDTTLIK